MYRTLRVAEANQLTTMKKRNNNTAPPVPLQRLVGQCYVFMRDGHDWDTSEVAVISITGKRYTVARATDVCQGLLAPQGSKKRKLKTWTCSHDELW